MTRTLLGMEKRNDVFDHVEKKAEVQATEKRTEMERARQLRDPVVVKKDLRRPQRRA